MFDSGWLVGGTNIYFKQINRYRTIKCHIQIELSARQTQRIKMDDREANISHNNDSKATGREREREILSETDKNNYGNFPLLYSVSLSAL